LLLDRVLIAIRAKAFHVDSFHHYGNQDNIRLVKVVSALGRQMN
jgi:hypothetical protein